MFSRCLKQFLPLVCIGLALIACESSPSRIDNSILVQASDLRVEFLKGERVRNIKDSHPEFSWAVKALDYRTSKHLFVSGLNEQVAYQIQVQELKNAGAWDNETLWDSGRVEVNSSVSQSYNGSALLAKKTYRWRVKLWFASDRKPNSEIESVWSRPQIFTMSDSLDTSTSRYDLNITANPAKVIKKLPSGRYLLDFGKAAFGYLELDLNSDRTGQIKVHLAERGDKNGARSELHERSSVRYYSVDLQVNEDKDTYRVHPPRNARNTKADKAIAIPGRFGRIAPFRYVEIDPKGINISDISASQIAIAYPFDDHASFMNSSNPVLNGIWDLSKYSIKATSFAGIYVDGDRERIPYEADAYINQLSHYLVEDEYSLARYSHEYLLEHPTWPTEWRQHSIMMAWTDWMYTGDTESIRKHYEVLKTKLLIELSNETGLLESFPKRTKAIGDIVDWPPVERDGFDFKRVNSVVNAFHYLNLNQMAQMAEAIGEQDDAIEYRIRAKKVYTSFNNLLWNPSTGLYLDGRGSEHSAAHANILPLAVGLVAKEKVPKIVAFLRSKKMAVSVYFAQYYLEALYLNGEQDYAFELLSATGLRSWYNMLRVGSTITLEAWDDKFKPNQDWNHAWGAVPANIIGRYILGVKPSMPGFHLIEIAPQLSNLRYIEGVVPTIKGPVSIKAKQDENGTTILIMTIPHNAQAIFKAPLKKNLRIAQLSVNGSDVGFDASTGELLEGLLSSGDYEIHIRYIRKE